MTSNNGRPSNVRSLPYRKSHRREDAAISAVLGCSGCATVVMALSLASASVLGVVWLAKEVLW